MKTTSLLCFSLLVLILGCSKHQFTQIQSEIYEPTAHSRGLDFQNGIAVFAGSNGFYHIQEIGGSNLWDTTAQLHGLEDIRDVEVLDNNSIFFLNSGELGLILRKDPESFLFDTVFYQNNIFLDGIDFWESEPFYGLAFGDPVNEKLFILKMTYFGDSVRVIENVPLVQDGEAGFAASGSSIQVVDETPTAFIGTGGCEKPRLYYTNDYGETWGFRETPMKGGASNGIYSLYFWNENEGMIIGGSYIDSMDNEKMCFYTDDGGVTWDERNNGLPGYCSSIHGEFEGGFIIATGRNGTFYTLDKGLNWLLFSKEAYYSVKIYNDNIFFTGKGGKWAVWEYTLKD